MANSQTNKRKPAASKDKEAEAPAAAAPEKTETSETSRRPYSPGRQLGPGRIVSFQYMPNVKNLPFSFGGQRDVPAIVLAVRDGRADVRAQQASDLSPPFFRGVEHICDAPWGASNWCWPDERARLDAGDVTIEGLREERNADREATPDLDELASVGSPIIDELVARIHALESTVDELVAKIDASA